ncbi:MAG TPA: prepilin-type N-terminal cleavage/methylation domain-containing protein [Candidatus Acidoferrales bacterium]|nr:prepilin-type N-terminal cleavage/methylation domain-containing protein [Candidatus Acidoferrales bacterium]
MPQSHAASTMRRDDEAGFTLIEIIVVVSIVAIIIVLLIPPSLGTSPGLLRSVEAHTQAMLSATRALAESNAGSGNTGATLQFSYDTATGETVERVYYNRPIHLTFGNSPVILNLDLAIPAYRFKGKASMANVASAPPFAIFIGSADHVSAAALDFASDPEDSGEAAEYLSNEPANCTSSNSLSIIFTVGAAPKTDTISCYRATLST